MPERHYDDVKHDYRLARAELALRVSLRQVAQKPFNFGHILIEDGDFGEYGDTITSIDGGIQKDVLMAMLQTGLDMVTARLAERNIKMPITDDP